MHALPIGLLCSTLVLSGCGGTEPPSALPISATCELPLKHADGKTSGIRIEAVASAVARQFNPCAIEQLESAKLSLCISHQQIGELSAELILPNQVSWVLDLNKAVRSPGCLGDNLFGQLFTLPLPLNQLQAFQALQGDWSVKVSDNNTATSTPIGFLVGWSMLVQGLQ